MEDPPRGSRRRFRKRIVRRHDGTLLDRSERRRISATELRDYIRDGGLFEARREESGADCTYEVLRDVMGTGLLEGMVPNLGANPLSGLGALGALTGGSSGLGGLGGAAGELARLARLASTDDRDRDRDWVDWDDEPRRSSRRRERERDGNGRDEPPPRPKRSHDDWHLLEED
ncbi:MAG: hypothetical protein ACRDYV_19870 [Acidimicrobiia bacterium]